MSAGQCACLLQWVTAILIMFSKCTGLILVSDTDDTILKCEKFQPAKTYSDILLNLFMQVNNASTESENLFKIFKILLTEVTQPSKNYDSFSGLVLKFTLQLINCCAVCVYYFWLLFPKTLFLRMITRSLVPNMVKISSTLWSHSCPQMDTGHRYSAQCIAVHWKNRIILHVTIPFLFLPFLLQSTIPNRKFQNSFLHNALAHSTLIF